MTEQRRPRKYPDELRERAVRLVFEAERHTASQWEAICSVADKLGPTAETVRKWVRRVEIDDGHRPGLTTDERERMKELERENQDCAERMRSSSPLRVSSRSSSTAVIDGLRGAVRGTTKRTTIVDDATERPP